MYNLGKDDGIPIGAILKLALFLTLARIALLPLFLVIYLFYPSMGISLIAVPYILLGILLLCELSDIFDGVAARRSNQVTNLGKILDPMADSIVRLSILLTFTQGIVKVPLLLILIFVCRDAVISTLRTLCALNGTALAARWSGKVKAVMQAIAIFMADALETGDAAYIAKALGVVARAKGMAEISEQTGLSREQLYRSFSEKGNPTLKTMLAVMKALGIDMTAKLHG